MALYIFQNFWVDTNLKAQGSVIAPDFFFFFVRGIEGAKCDFEGEKSINLLKMADFFRGEGGKWGRQSLQWGGGNASMLPLMLPLPLLVKHLF